MMDPEPELGRVERFVRRYVLPLMFAALLVNYLVERYLPVQP